MSTAVIEKLRRATGLNDWKVEENGSYSLDVTAAGIPRDLAKGFDRIINYFFSTLVDIQPNISFSVPMMKDHSRMVPALYDASINLPTALTVLDALERSRGGYIRASWGAIPHRMMFLGGLKDPPVGVIHKILIRAEDASNDHFLGYLKEFPAAQSIFKQIGEELGRKK